MVVLLGLLVSVTFILPVSTQLSVTWNGSTITGPVLIYFDEIIIDNYKASEIGNVSRPGALVCRSENRARVSWHFTSGLIVSDAPRTDSRTIIQTRTGEGVTPSVSRLSKTRMFASSHSEQNGLWHCRLNARGERDAFGAIYEDQINVGVFASRSRGNMSMIKPLYLTSSSFESTPPTFTLHSDTSGGPPTDYNWTRDGQVITHGTQYNISIAVNQTEYENSRYRSTLTVTGHLPGLYQYSATNRATPTVLTSTYSIEEGSCPTNLRAVQIELGSVQVSWTASSPPPARGYQVTAQPGGVDMTVSSSSVSISLQPGQVYSIQVMALSQHLPSQPVGPVQVEVKVPGVVSNLVAEVRFTSVVLSWSAPQEPNGVIIAYEVTYRINDSDLVTTNTTNTRLIRELAPSTRVSAISVRILTNIGLGNAETHQSLSISENPVPLAVVRTALRALSNASVTISWESVTIPGIVSYTVYYRPVARPCEQVVTVPSSESSAVIECLTSGVEYQFQVAAIGILQDGTTVPGERSNIVRFTPSPDSASTSASDVPLAVSLTFVLTVILCAALRLVEFGVTRAYNSSRKHGNADREQPVATVIYEEMENKHEKDIGMAMQENAAYGPVTSD